MKILLVAKVPAYFEQFKQKNLSFPYFQSQTHWQKALSKLNHSTKTYLYSNSIICPHKLSVTLSNFFDQHTPTLFTRYRLIKNKLYFLNPENYFRSISLCSLIKSYQPGKIIIAGGVSELLSFPLKLAKEQKATIFMLHGEDPLQSATSFERQNIKFFDWIITNDPTHAKNWKKLGAKNTLALPYSAIDPTFHKKVNLSSAQKESLGADVVFAGTLLPDRQKILKKLTHFNLKIFGHIPSTFKLDPSLTKHYYGQAWGKKMVNIFNASKIVLNFVPSHMPTGGNLRTFEIPGCGAFQLVSRCPKEWFIPNKEIVIFSSTKDLIQKINYYLKNPIRRSKIAQAGHHKTHQHHTYQKRFEAILKFV